MLCQICHEREASVHFSQDVGTHTTKVDLCELCFRTTLPEVAEDFERIGQLPAPNGETDTQEKE